MGKINPEADWDHIGALDASRVRVHSKGWMLPSSHLMLYESPQAGAKRILREQLDLKDAVLEDPKMVSEVYTPKRFPNLPRHWDLEFIFRSEIKKSSLRTHKAWRELRFIDVDKIPRSDIARSHDDILDSVGLHIPY
jgi:ADP-ribose pyrophosphatase YjhB (NUDIX family)